MPRTARKKSQTGIYHVMLRGINQQIIFEDQQDYQYFLYSLKDTQQKSNFTLHAYCLMNNHVHLLIAENDEPLKTVFRRICDKYVYYYNHKYNRVGHLFQDRFRSEPVDNTQYLLTICRYILQNPLKAGLVQDISLYPWTNYTAFLGETDAISSVDIISNMFSSHKECVSFLNAISDDTCMDVESKRYNYRTDEEGLLLIKEIVNCESMAAFQQFTVKERDYYLRKIKSAGLSVRQISRLTGISKTIIGRV